MPKRRANGEGNIRKRKDGRWEGRYTVGHDPETGKAIIKNVLGKTQAEDKEKLKKELGDVAWYLAEAAQGLNVPLSEILQGNLNKLHGRYPNGFSSERSMHRENAE